MPTKHAVYWWNLENLFDVENSPLRPEWLQNRLKKELRGWDQALLDRKIDNLCSIIKRFNDNTGPDILGVCEVENENVVQLLMHKVRSATGRNYTIRHQDTKDKRGIDVAIIYDSDKYTDDGHQFSLEIMKRNATRDLFQINVQTRHNNELVLIGNHWPSRSGGKFESEPYRMMVGEILSYWIDRIHEIKLEKMNQKSPSIVIMGDMNDNPYDRSVTEYLQSTPSKERVRNARNNILYNPMHQFLGGDTGTHVYGNKIDFLDQFIVSKAFIVNSSGNPFKLLSNAIISFPEMISGDYNKPIRFSRPSAKGGENTCGFSDHLPIEMIIEERD